MMTPTIDWGLDDHVHDAGRKRSRLPQNRACGDEGKMSKSVILKAVATLENEPTRNRPRLQERGGGTR
jgi:hypothetical protein